MIAPPHPQEAQRRAEIKRRRETSVFWACVHLLGSLKVAVVLLISIAALIAFATVMESRFDSDVARYYIYDNSLFKMWLFVLVLNLLCAAFTRWPWQRKHVGFVVTHAGIILMLAGAVIGHSWGFEAFVTLDKTKPPESRLIVRENIVTVQAPNGARWQMPFESKMRPPSEERPVILPVEGTNLRIVIDRATENLEADDTLAPSADPTAPAGVAVHFLNPGMGQNAAAILMQTPEMETYDFFGMAKVKLVDSLDEAHPITPAKVEEAKPASPPPEAALFHETQIVFARDPQPVVDNDTGTASGYTAKLSAVAGKPTEFELIVTAPNGTVKSWPVQHLLGKWHNVLGDGDPVHLRVAKYWPEFAMKPGGPVSLSDQPKNPAVLLQITGPGKPAVEGKAPAPTGPQPMPKGLAMRIALAKEPGKIVYETEREGKLETRAVAAKGETVRLGWSKWEMKVDDALAHAEVLRDMKECVGTPPPMMAASMRPGLRARLETVDGKSGPAVWVPAGTSRLLLSGKDFSSDGVRMGYGQRVIPLTYTITLEDFQVPRDEGTDTPSNYISTLRFDEPSTGRVVHGTAQMNSPAMFPGEFWRSLVGMNYKYSQANWDPENLNETTLQVLYDPGWLFKWTGSLGICIGIALMFYFMPKRSAQERSGREDADEEPGTGERRE